MIGRGREDDKQTRREKRLGRQAMDISVRAYLEEGVIDRLAGLVAHVARYPAVRSCSICFALRLSSTRYVKGDAN